MPASKTLPLVLGAVLAAAAGLVAHHAAGLTADASITAAVTVLCAVWWCTEALPIPVTALVPFVVFPLTGVLDHTELAAAWGDKFILLFMGGFMISRAAEKSRAHLRLAHGVIRVVGTGSKRKLIVGFMLATALCSMWISNTATALIMLPVAMAVIRTQGDDDDRFAVSLLLAIAYGASAGGVATVIGSPPNGIMVSVYEQETGRSIDFLSWMRVGVPVAIAMLGAVAVVLTVGVRGPAHAPSPPGPWTAAQRRTLIVIGGTALLWITRTLPLGLGGWSVWLGTPDAHDATVALLAVLVMFLVPNGERTGDGKRDHLLDWDTARDIPWGILLLFAGGLAIAQAVSATGLAETLSAQLEGVAGAVPLLLLIALLAFAVTFTTEVTSNTATATLLMPILCATANAIGVDPAMLMIPAALSCSCAFMLPVATPPNAIVFGGSKQLTIPKMAKRGVVLNLIGVVVIALVCVVVVDREDGLGGAATAADASITAPSRD